MNTVTLNNNNNTNQHNNHTSQNLELSTLTNNSENRDGFLNQLVEGNMNQPNPHQLLPSVITGLSLNKENSSINNVSEIDVRIKYNERLKSSKPSKSYNNKNSTNANPLNTGISYLSVII
jgi:hypothetical protein